MSNLPVLTRSASKKSGGSSNISVAASLNDLLNKNVLVSPQGVNLALHKSASSKS